MPPILHLGGFRGFPRREICISAEFHQLDVSKSRIGSMFLVAEQLGLIMIEKRISKLSLYLGTTNVHVGYVNFDR